MRTKIGLVFFVVLLLSGCAGRLPTPGELARENFGRCLPDYKERMMAYIGASLIDPYSAIYRFGEPEKYVSGGKFGYRVVVGVNAKNRFGGYVGEDLFNYMCFADGSISPINALATGMYNGMRKGIK